MTPLCKAGLYLPFVLINGLVAANAQEPKPADGSPQVVVHIVDLFGKPVRDVPLKPDYFLKGSPATVRPGMAKEIPAGSPSLAYPAASQATDANGNASFKSPPAGYTLYVAAVDDRFAQFSSNKHAHLALTADSQTTTVIVSPGGAIEGTVKYAASGLPAAGILVGAIDTDPDQGLGITYAVTDAHGVYKLTQLVPDTYNVELNLPPHGSSWTSAAKEKISVPASATIAGTDFNLIEGSVIRGVVKDEDTNKPIPGVTVALYGPAHPPSSRWPSETVSQAAGSFTFRVPPGKQRLIVVPASPGEQEIVKDIDVLDGRTESVVMQIPAPDAWKTVSGRVVGPDGKPVAGATVTNVENGYEATSAHDGSFHVVLARTADACTLCSLKGTLATAGPTAGKAGGAVVLHLAPKVLGKVVGGVKDDHGMPIIYAYVNLQRKGQTVAVAKTDILGGYTFDGLYPGVTYSVIVDERGYVTTNTATGLLKPGQSLVMTSLVIKKVTSAVARATGDRASLGL